MTGGRGPTEMGGVGSPSRLTRPSWRRRLRAPSAPRLVRALRSSPVALGYAILLWAVQGATPILQSLPADAMRERVGASAWTLFARPWSLVTAAFWVQGAAVCVASTVALLLVGVPLERRLGSPRFAAAAAASQILGVIAAAGLTWAIRGMMGFWSADLMSHRYLGLTAALCGAMMAATATLPALWRRRLRTSVPLLLLVLALYEGSFADLVRLAAAVVGVLVGPLLWGRRPVLAWPTISRREARVLLALCVTACAVGPVIAGLSPNPSGPLSVLRFLFTDIQSVDPKVLASTCANPLNSSGCQMMLLQLRAGAGGIFMAILPCLLLLVCAEGLRRGRRFAWGATLVVLGGMAALAVTHILLVLWPTLPVMIQEQSVGFPDLSHSHHPLGLVLPLLLPVVLFVLIAGFRNFFTLTAPRGTYRRLGLMILLVGIGLAVVYVSGGVALSRGFTPIPSLTQFVADVPDRFLPLGYTLDIPPAIFPESTRAVLLYEGTGIAFWLVTGTLVLVSFLQPASTEDGTDPARVRTILRSASGSPLSWMTTWSGNRYWFTPDGRGYVAYRVIFGIALALGPPVAPTVDSRAGVEGFARFCGDNGWTPCFYSANRELLGITSAIGWRSMEIAQQAILPLACLTFSGRRFQNVRSALNRAQKDGIRAEWVSYATASSRIRRQIHELSEEWIADQKLPELGFTLGGVAELQDPEVRCLLALDANLTVHAVTSWLPVYHEGTIAGWTLDLMRRRRNGFPNSMEFLIATAALTLRDEGYAYVSLSGVPLVRSVQTADDGASTASGRLLDWVGKRLEPVYGFRSLMAFKSKFAPYYEPLYLVYPEAAVLPNTANAIAMAYLGDISMLRRLGLFRQMLVRHKAQSASSTLRTVGPEPEYGGGVQGR